MMPVGGDADGLVRGQVRAQPLFLCRTGAAAADLRAVAVEHYDVPAAQVVAVVALPGITGGRSEIDEVAGRPPCVVVVVAGRWQRPCPVPTPRRGIVAGELGVRAGAVGVIAQRENRAGDSIQEIRRRLVAGPSCRYVTSAYQSFRHRIVERGPRRRGSTHGANVAVLLCARRQSS